MKKQVYISILLISMMLSVQNTSAETIRMGYFMLPPLQYMDNAAKKSKGASFVYFDALASQMGCEVEWIGPFPLLRLSELLKKGELDGSMGFVKNAELEPFFYYPETPLFFSQPTLIVREDNPISRIRSIEDIRGYRIGTTVAISGRYTPMIDTHPDALTLEPLGGETWIEQNLQKLVAGRVDAVFDRQPYSMQYIAADLRLDTQVKLLPIPDPPVPLYIVFSKASRQGQELLEKCNAVLPQFHLKYEDLVQKELDALREKK